MNNKQTRTENGCLIIKPTHRFDVFQHTLIKQQVEAYLQSVDCPDVTFDFQMVNFIDLSTARLLPFYFQQVKENGGRFRMLNLNTSVRIIFELLNLQTLIPQDLVEV